VDQTETQQGDQTHNSPTRQKWQTIAAAAFVLALVHFYWPSLAVDFVALSLLAFALVLLFFDVDKFELHGIRALRRELEEATVAVEAAATPPKAAIPPQPPSPRGTDPPAETEPTGETPSKEPTREENLTKIVEVGRDRATIFQDLYDQIRIELLIIAGSDGNLPRQVDWESYTSGELLVAVSHSGILPREITHGLNKIFRARREVLHRDSSGSLLDTAIQLANEVLQQLRAVPRTYARIREPDITFFWDRELTQPSGRRGIILAQIDSKGQIVQLLPVPRARAYSEGDFVSWEWDPNRSFVGPVWYQDPETLETRRGRDNVATFLGRVYPSEWKLENRFSDARVGLA
jgi:hypothetical protein